MIEFETELMRYQERVGPRLCSFGITEAIAAAAAFVPELAGATAGADALAAGGADAALAAGTEGVAAGAGAGLATGLGDAGGLTALLGGGDVGAGGLGTTEGLASTAGALGPAAAPASGLSTAALGPSTAAGITPATAPPIDLASAAAAQPGGDVTASFTGSNLTSPLDTPFAPSTAGNGVWSDTSEMLSQGFNPSTTLTGGAAPTAPTSDLSTLLSGGTGPAATPGAPAATTAGVANAGAGASGIAAPGTSGNFLDSLTAGATKAVTNNPLGIALSAGGLGYSVLEGQKVSANEQALQAAAGTQAGQGQALSNYIQTGQLPPGMAAQVANATAAAKAAIISGYASRGQNANPSQNSALAQELSQVDMNALAMQGQLATQLLSAGLQESNMSDQLYAQLIGIDQTQAKNTGAAIANFASALAGGPKSIQIGNTPA